MNVVYSKEVIKAIKKGKLTRLVWINFRDAFTALTITNNFKLFDIKKMLQKEEHNYYRMRIGKYRALFRVTEDKIYVEKILPRGEVYK